MTSKVRAASHIHTNCGDLELENLFNGIIIVCSYMLAYVIFFFLGQNKLGHLISIIITLHVRKQIINPLIKTKKRNTDDGSYECANKPSRALGLSNRISS